MIGINMQINKLRAADSQPAAPTPGTEYPSQSMAYPPAGSTGPVATTDNSDANAPSGTEYPPQPGAYQPFAAPAPVPAATDNSAKLAELTAEMQACATNDDFTRAMELQEQV